MRMFERGGKKPLKDVSNGTAPAGLWPTNSGPPGRKKNETEVSGGNAAGQATAEKLPADAGPAGEGDAAARDKDWQPGGSGLEKKGVKNDGFKKTEAGFQMGPNQKKSKPPK